MPLPPELPTPRRDGTSQADRLGAAPDPAAIGVDERTNKDLLAFAKAFATQLVYYDANNQPAGDWSGLFGDLREDQILDFLDNPRTDAEARLRRPHFVLFVTLLRLLATARDALNGLPRRQLDYYYREVLRLIPERPAPDRVFVLFDLGAGTDAVEIPAGTRLAAGRDAAKRERFYLTDKALIANRAEIARLASLFAQKKIIGLAEAHAAPVGTKEERFLAMMSLVLGEPLPGGPLPLYGGQAVTYAKLDSLASLVEFSFKNLFLRQFELRQLIDRKHARDTADGDWAQINSILQAAGRKRRNDDHYVLNPANPRDFNANLAAALNGAPDLSGLPEVTTVDDLYVQRYRQDVQNAIVQKLFMSVDTFVSMMDLKRASDTDWHIVNSLLEHAGRVKRNDQTYKLPIADPTNFAANMATAIGPVDFTSTGTSNIDAYAAAIVALEQYMFMPADTFAAMMRTADQPEAQVAATRWQDIYGTLGEARRQKVFAARRDALRKIREATANPAAGLLAILAEAAGENTGVGIDTLLAELTDFVSPAELTFLTDLATAATVTQAQWTQAYDILERAGRKRTQMPDPLPVREDWLNLYAYADATMLRPVNGDTSRWKTFGAAPEAQTSDQPPPPEVIGLAIGSPLFSLSSGDREITINLGFYDDGGGPLPTAAEAFSVQVSTAKGWVTPDGVDIADGADVDYSKLDDIAPLPAGIHLLGLRLRLRFPPSAPPIAGLPPGQIDCPWPVVRIMLRQIWDPAQKCFVIRYARLRSLRLARVHLRAATGAYLVSPPGKTPVTPLLLENDSGPLNGKRPFEPFGAQPAAGAMLWIGHPDLLRKRLRSLRLLLEWMGGPADLNTNYAAYPVPPNWIFSAQVSLVQGTLTTPQGSTPSPLFALTNQKQDATKPQSIEIAAVADSLASYTLPAGEPMELVRDLPRALRLELTPIGFGHQIYPELVTAKAIQLAADSANVAAHIRTTAIDPTQYVVGQPYTPTLKSFALEFVAGHELRMEAYQPGPTTDMVFHLHPFGVTEARAAADGFPFLPDYSNEGELLIGIAGFQPPENLSLLFQMADGSGNPDAENQPVSWSVLDTEGWVTLPAEAILEDATHGLINSGIATFALPPATPDPRLPSGLYWLRAAVPSGAAAVCDTVAIHTQAVSATREVTAGAAPDPVRLPAFTIKAPVAPIVGVAAVRQPYNSFGGRQAQQDDSFYAAASERLRHKQRAVTPWDYERLVLRRFPEVYKVKCISASLADAPPRTRDSDNLGMVGMIVVPDIRGKSLFDPFEPKASAALLADIASYMTPLLPGSARLRVQNARYVQVRIRVGVRFSDQNNPVFYRQQLNDELNRYLSPWAYDEGADIVIGRRIYAGSIIDFIEQRSYVDYVAGIKLFSSDDGQTFTLAPAGGPDGDGVGSDWPDAVLVAARQHQIDLIRDEIFAADEFKGVNYMKIELDFVVG
jgi:Baseplate J-like protein